MPCFMCRDTNHQFMGYAVMKPNRRAMDIMNQNIGLDGSRLAGALFIAHATGTMPAMRQFMDSNSGKKALASARLYEPPAFSRMNSAWKILHPKPNPKTYSSAISVVFDKWNTLAMTAPARIPTPSPATQCMVEPSTCLQRVAT